MSPEIEDATQPNIDESPFDEGLEPTAENVAPGGREDVTVPTETAPLPRPYGEDDEEQTAVLGRADPPTDVEIHAPAMGPEPSRGRPSAPLLVMAAAVLLVVLAGCLIAAVRL